jgi:hypothetical protein
VLDIAGILDRLAYRRYVIDDDARPDWWQPYDLSDAIASCRRDQARDSSSLTASVAPREVSSALRYLPDDREDAVVVPVDPFQGGHLNDVQGTLGPFAADRFEQRIVNEAPTEPIEGRAASASRSV